MILFKTVRAVLQVRDIFLMAIMTVMVVDSVIEGVIDCNTDSAMRRHGTIGNSCGTYLHPGRGMLDECKRERRRKHRHQDSEGRYPGSDDTAFFLGMHRLPLYG